MDRHDSPSDNAGSRSIYVQVSRFRRAGGAVVREHACADLPVIRPGDGPRGVERRPV